MVLSDTVTSPIGTLVVLAKITVGVWCRSWVLYGATHTYKCPLSVSPSSVKWNRTGTLTLAASLVAVESNAATYWWEEGFLYVRAPGGQTVFSITIQAVVSIGASMPDPRTVSGVQYEPRLKSIPNLSQRIESYFGGVGQIGGGSMTFDNTDGYYDDKPEWQWDGGKVELFAAMDVPNAAAVDGDYAQLATWLVDDWSRTRNEFTLRLKEPKARIKAKIPVATFTRAAFPNLEEGNVGLPIPLAYGVIKGAKPILVDPGLKKFKCANHAVSSFDGVRLKKEKTQAVTATGFQWLGFSAPTAGYAITRTYLPNVEIKSVKNGATSFTRVDDVADLSATTSAWSYSEGWVYVHAANSVTLSALSITYEFSTSFWESTNFSTTNLSDGTFTLGAAYAPGTEVSLDFTGKPNAEGYPIEAGPDVTKDILETVGETLFESSSFSGLYAQKNRLLVGTAGSKPYYSRAISLYIDEKRDALEVIGEINAATRSFVYANELGEYSVGVFNPYAISVDPFTYADILDFSESFDTEKLVSKFTSYYKVNKQEEVRQSETIEDASVQYIHDQPNAISEEKETPFSVVQDAIDLARESIFMRGVPLRRVTVTVGWIGLNYSVGDLIPLNIPEKQINQTFEVLERTIDLTRKTVKFVLGDMRGIGNKMGWWQSDSVVLPSSFSGLTGYGAGSATWNDAWDPTIKQWAKNNLGYWTDDYGKASSTDSDSFNVSNWI